MAHRARLSALFGQSVAEGLGAYRIQLEQASYDPALLASALFGELPDDGPVRADLPEWSDAEPVSSQTPEAAAASQPDATAVQTTPADYEDTVPVEDYDDAPSGAAACAASLSPPHSSLSLSMFLNPRIQRCSRLQLPLGASRPVR